VTAESRPDSMRKHMTRAYDEVLGADPAVVYLGEDVEHGGSVSVEPRCRLCLIVIPPDTTW
jgi:hypothetical protein